MAAPYDFKAIEKEILAYWQKNKTYQKAKARNKGKDAFYFLDGPPYTSGKVHLGTAWNKALKDMVIRYKRMQGFDVYDRAGYDMHGLPTEHATQKKLGLKTKDDILAFGIKKFIQECKKLCIENMKEMNLAFQKEGVWMDFDNAYQSITKEFIEAEWWLVKKAHDKGRLYQGLKTIHWCPSCSTAMAKHELEYKLVKDNSIFLKFPVKGKKNEFLIVWTTTPWTIPFNLAVMVHPEFEYVKAKVDNEIWIVAKALAGPFIQGVVGKSFTVIEELTGEKLEGLEYVHPLHNELKSHYEEIKSKAKKAFTVLLSEEYVDLSAGTGLVHMAPGCGPEDYEVGHRNGIPPLNLLDEKGFFPNDAGAYAGLSARKEDNKFTEVFGKNGCLIAETVVEHDYPHCQRCKAAVVYRTTKQWFFKVEDLKQKMIAENKKIKWVPEAAFNAFNAWLENLRDNSITKQRFWGTPLPVWQCQSCNAYDVFGSEAELKKAAGKAPKDLHKPEIDEITYRCACGGKKERIPDILDVWVDAGTASWNALDYPVKKALFEKLFPADFILEGKDQIRGWFNLLMVASMIALDAPSFKSVYMHGFVNDAQGRKMSKSLGNYILPEEVYEQYGADTFRYYAIGGANPGLDLNYNMEDVKLKYKNLAVLWNIHNFLIDICSTNKINPAKLKVKKNELGREEQHILSKLNSTIKAVTDAMQNHLLNKVPAEVESLFLELSRTYIQLVRDKAALGAKEEKEAVAYTVFTVLLEALKMLSIVSPFITEKIYLNLKQAFKLKELSIHHYRWPEVEEALIDETLEKDMAVAANVMQAILAAREKAHIGVRWPMAEVIIAASKDIQHSLERSKDIIMSQTNVKKVEVKESFFAVKATLEPDMSQLGPDFGKLSPKIAAAIAKEKPETILDSIQKNGKFELEIEGKKISIVKEHLIVKRDIPKPYLEAEFVRGLIYLNTAMTPELEGEGFAREIMRRIQALRKKEGMERKDAIDLYIKADKDICSRIQPWESSIREKVGASQIEISAEAPSKKFRVSSKERVKDHAFEIFF